MQAKRKPNPSGANWKYAESVLSEFTKKLKIKAINKYNKKSAVCAIFDSY